MIYRKGASPTLRVGLALSLAVLALGLGCFQAPPPAGGGAAPGSVAPGSVAPGSVALQAPQLPAYVERVVGGASSEERLPMIVAIHGLGDRPEAFAGWLEGLDVKARVILPRGLTAHGPGFSWFPIRRAEGRIADPAEVDAAADQIAALVAKLEQERPTVGRPVVLGFSQGGMLTFALAARHPARFAAALPIAGTPIGEAGIPAGAPPLVVFHGEADERVPPGGALARVEALKGAGVEASAHLYPGLGHGIHAGLRADVYAELRRRLAAPPAARVADPGPR